MQQKICLFEQQTCWDYFFPSLIFFIMFLSKSVKSQKWNYEGAMTLSSTPIDLSFFWKIFELLNLQEKCTETWTSESQNKVVILTLHKNSPNWLDNLKQKYRNDVIWFSNSLLKSKNFLLKRKVFYLKFHIKVCFFCAHSGSLIFPVIMMLI